ncbi:MAG: hypothetical protein LBP51_04360 [Deferribacteraceae bacterium]|jgi:hypothetical protein|nr:hypothetical protein [Deferribacteraceae bacterium]
MIATNIYKNYTATLSELYRQEVNVVSPDLGEITLSTSQKEEASFLKTFLVALVGFAAAAAVTILIVNPFKAGSDFPEYTPDTLSKPIIAPNTQYVQIQLIEFEDSPADLEILPSLYSKDESAEIQPEQTMLTPTSPPDSLITNKTVEPDKASPPIKSAAPKQTSPPPPVQRANPVKPPKPLLYSLKVDGISLSDYNRLKEVVGGKVNITADRSAEHINMWALYIPASGTGMFIEGSEVLPHSYYSSKEDAVKAAEEKADKGQASIIKMESVQNDLYNVALCCLELETAKEAAQKSGITDRVFQLRRR